MLLAGSATLVAVTTTRQQSGRQVGAEARFDALVGAIHDRLPGRTSSWVPRTFVGFTLINGTTFGVDLALLALLYRGLGLPNPVSVTAAYLVAFTLAFVLNRWLNFHSHEPVGGQVGKYVAVVVVNYTLLILGVGAGLIALGVPFVLARMAAGLCEALWMYAAMRWWVFRR